MEQSVRVFQWAPLEIVPEANLGVGAGGVMPGQGVLHGNCRYHSEITRF